MGKSLAGFFSYLDIHLVSNGWPHSGDTVLPDEARIWPTRANSGLAKGVFSSGGYVVWFIPDARVAFSRGPGFVVAQD